MLLLLLLPLPWLPLLLFLLLPPWLPLPPLLPWLLLLPLPLLSWLLALAVASLAAASSSRCPSEMDRVLLDVRPPPPAHNSTQQDLVNVARTGARRVH